MPRGVDALIQAGVLLLGGAAVWLAADPDPGRRALGFALGLASQPFWLAGTLRARQWGMFAAALLYTLAWARGAWLQWRP